MRAAADMPAGCADVWTQALILPLNKDADAEKIRPTALGQYLLNFAKGSLPTSACLHSDDFSNPHKWTRLQGGGAANPHCQNSDPGTPGAGALAD